MYSRPGKPLRLVLADDPPVADLILRLVQFTFHGAMGTSPVVPQRSPS
jgi:hypothetical protein